MNNHSESSEQLMETLSQYRYAWPQFPLSQEKKWHFDATEGHWRCNLPEVAEELRLDSRWPALFPSPMCVITTGDGTEAAMEREVGASIVNRFPYVVAISLCRTELSSRHHARTKFMDLLERTGSACLQFLPPGEELDAALNAITSLSDADSIQRIKHSGLRTRQALTNSSPVLAPAYLAYEAKLVKPQKDFEGSAIYESPWVDVGSHRIYFLEINAIQLRKDIAIGASQIRWRALPAWSPQSAPRVANSKVQGLNGRYQKGYNPNYAFPANSTIAFEWNELRDGMAVMHVPPLPEDQVQVDNDRARWPCFFPSSCGLITTWDVDGKPNIMPCGSTTIVSRQPLVVAPCVSYAKINERYATRKTLSIIRKTGRFGCSVPYINDTIISGLKYAGNNSLTDDPEKVVNSGFTISYSEFGPIIKEAPIHFECVVTNEILLGTHVMFLGEVRGICVRADVTPSNPLEWCPWPGLAEVEAPALAV